MVCPALLTSCSSLQQLERADEATAVRDQHLVWCVALAEQATPALQGPEQGRWLARLREHDNLQAAMRWSLHAGSGGAQALRLAGLLARFWLGHGHLREGRHWLTEVLATGAGTGVERARALDGAGLFAEGQGDYEEATRLLEESLALWREVGDRPVRRARSPTWASWPSDRATIRGRGRSSRRRSRSSGS